MKITKIRLENYKSIKSIEFPIKKYGKSYTTTLVGINESGKSNILNGMSFFKRPEDSYVYNDIHNQKDIKDNPIDFWYYLEFEDKDTCQIELKKLVDGGEYLSFQIKNIIKNVYLESGKTEFLELYLFDIDKLPKNLFFKIVQKNTVNTLGQATLTERVSIRNSNDDTSSYEELTVENFKKIFQDDIEKIIARYEPNVSTWKPSDKFLVSDVDLNVFKDDVESNIPLKHIFYIAGIEKAEDIKKEIEKITTLSLRRRLAGTLGSEATKYIQNIWNHDIIIDIEIAESGMCTVSIRDGGKVNEFNYHKMTSRSEGFKQFMSLILSLSVETKMSKRKNDLILIDEPEAHLHPSGIRDLRVELLKIGESNCLFTSTHSPFLVDKVNKERNIIIRKNKSASTEKIEIDKHTEVIDDEVLREAFGIEVYNDLLNPHSILVEGASDKKILLKALALKGHTKYGITNGHGSNVDTLAAKLNDTDISILIILDDDDDGKTYQANIQKLGGSYTADNVVTIRDLVGTIIDKGTIEDTLNFAYLESKAKEVYANMFTGELLSISLISTQAVIDQLKVSIQKVGKTKKQIDEYFETFKTKIAEDFNPSKGSLHTDYPLLEQLVDEIANKLG